MTGDKVVDSLLSQMTLTEKITLLAGQSVSTVTGDANQNQAGYLPGIARLGIPSLTLSDGPPGVVTKQNSTGHVGEMGVAATFDDAQAEAEGRVIGSDADALGQDVVLEPFINMDRDTTASRDWNTFGEDPYLIGRMGAAEIRGIQSTGTMAMAKHYIAYDGGNNVSVDAQTLHEIYLAPFADAVDVGVSSIMCSYNAVNSTTHSSCGNEPTLTQILRDELGFRGPVVSDWGGTHSTLDLNAGLDVEMPSPTNFSVAKISAAIAAGQIQVSRVDQAVGRILYEYEQFGLLKKAPKHNVTAENRAADNKVIQETAGKAATLLKNSGGILPLSTDRSIALIGPGAGQTIATWGTGEKSGGIVSEQTGTYQVLQSELGAGASLSYAVATDLTGRVIPASALSGLVRTTTTDGTSTTSTGDTQIAFTTANGNALPAGSDYGWSGTLTVSEAGTYSVNLGILGGTGSLAIDGVTIDGGGGGFGGSGARYGALHANEGNGPLPTTDGLANFTGSVALTAGAHTITVTETADNSGAPVQVRASWVSPSQKQADHDAAVAAARTAGTAVVFAYAAQEGDLSTPLPGGQDQLIQDIAAVNPNVVVVLNNNQPIAMPWLSKVKAVLDMWIPGDRGGYATADVLLGAVNPGGKLPVTWPASIDQELAHQATHPERASAGVGTGCQGFSGFATPWLCPLTTYSEGVDIAYRFFAATNETPLYPFGYGLSYTTFAYSDEKVKSTSDGGLDVTFTLTNTGKADGDTVPQIYLGAPTGAGNGGAQFAPAALAAYDRVTLRAGQTKKFTIHVRERQLQYWSTASNGWTLAKGTRTVSVNSSATSTELSQSVTFPQAKK